MRGNPHQYVTSAKYHIYTGSIKGRGLWQPYQGEGLMATLSGGGAYGNLIKGRGSWQPYQGEGLMATLSDQAL